jgi:hypothetical protein
MIPTILNGSGLFLLIFSFFPLPFGIHHDHGRNTVTACEYHYPCQIETSLSIYLFVLTWRFACGEGWGCRGGWCAEEEISGQSSSMVDTYTTKWLNDIKCVEALDLLVCRDVLSRNQHKHRSISGFGCCGFSMTTNKLKETSNRISIDHRHPNA